jgi:hypothetical protein
MHERALVAISFALFLSFYVAQTLVPLWKPRNKEKVKKNVEIMRMKNL